MKALGTSLVLTFLLVHFTAHAGTIMSFENKDSKNPQADFEELTYIDNDFLRMDIKNGDNISTMIFDIKDKVLWNIDNKKKSYFEMKPENFKQMSAAMTDAMKRVEAQIAKLPPDRQEMARKMMNQMHQNVPIEKSKTVYTKISSNQKIGSWDCDLYEGTINNVKRYEIWSTDYKLMGLTSLNMESLNSMTDFFKEFSKGLSPFANIDTSTIKEDNYPQGIPVKTVQYSTNGSTQTRLLKSVQSKSTNLFKIPEGYTKQAIPLQTHQ